MYLCRRLLSKPSHLTGKTLIFPEHALPDAYEHILETPEKQTFKSKKLHDKNRQRVTRKIYKGEGGEPWYQ